jgi:hypothetical protein
VIWIRSIKEGRISLTSYRAVRVVLSQFTIENSIKSSGQNHRPVFVTERAVIMKFALHHRSITTIINGNCRSDGLVAYSAALLSRFRLDL